MSYSHPLVIHHACDILFKSTHRKSRLKIRHDKRVDIHSALANEVRAAAPVRIGIRYRREGLRLSLVSLGRVAMFTAYI